MRGQRQGGYLVSRIHQVSGRVFTRMLRRRGIALTLPQGRVLFGLWRDGAMPIREIAQRTGMGKSTLTSLLDRLERDGYLRRVRSVEDRRIVLIEPTARDARSQAVFARASEEMTAIYYRGFSPADIDRFEADLTRILENLQTPTGRPSPARPCPTGR